MDRNTWESMTPQDHEEWVRFQVWQQHRHGERQDAAADQRGHVQLGTPLSRRVLLLGVIALVVGLGIFTSTNQRTGLIGQMTVATNTNAVSAVSASSGGSLGHLRRVRRYR